MRRDTSIPPPIPHPQHVHVCNVYCTQGSSRLAIEVDGTESAAEIAQLKALSPVVVLLNVKEGVSRVHASRRVFEAVQQNAVTTPVIHHIRFAKVRLTL